jgi:hypothetical protein
MSGKHRLQSGRTPEHLPAAQCEGAWRTLVTFSTATGYAMQELTVQVVGDNRRSVSNIGRVFITETPVHHGAERAEETPLSVLCLRT